MNTKQKYKNLYREIRMGYPPSTFGYRRNDPCLQLFAAVVRSHNARHDAMLAITPIVCEMTYRGWNDYWHSTPYFPGLKYLQKAEHRTTFKIITKPGNEIGIRISLLLDKHNS